MHVSSFPHFLELLKSLSKMDNLVLPLETFRSHINSAIDDCIKLAREEEQDAVAVARARQKAQARRERSAASIAVIARVTGHVRPRHRPSRGALRRLGAQAWAAVDDDGR